jgi:putative transposase
VINWVHKAELQPDTGQNPDSIAVDETVIRLNNEQYWLYAAVGPETNELRHTTLEPTANKVITHAFFTEFCEKHDVENAVFLIDGSHSLKDACRRHGLDFKYEKHGNRNSVERVVREIKRRTTIFSNYFRNAVADTADKWFRGFSSHGISLSEHYRQVSPMNYVASDASEACSPTLSYSDGCVCNRSSSELVAR